MYVVVLRQPPVVGPGRVRQKSIKQRQRRSNRVLAACWPCEEPTNPERAFCLFFVPSDVSFCACLCCCVWCNTATVEGSDYLFSFPTLVCRMPEERGACWGGRCDHTATQECTGRLLTMCAQCKLDRNEVFHL